MPLSKPEDQPASSSKACQASAGQEATYHSIFNALQYAIFVHDLETGAILDINLRGEEMFGYSAREFKSLNVDKISLGQAPFDQARAMEKLAGARRGQTQVFDWRCRNRQGRVFWAEVCIKQAEINGKMRLLAMVHDISERKRRQEQLKLAEQIFANTIEGVVVTGPDEMIQMVNPAFSQITGYSAQEAVGKKPSIMLSQMQDKDFYQDMWTELRRKGFWRGEVWNRRKSGEAYPQWLTITAIKDDAGLTTHYVGLFHDITEIKRSQDEISHLAYHDALTGLPNRALFEDRLAQALAQARRHNSLVGVLYLDLDDFKQINDTQGHPVGDKVLKTTARRLSGCVREEDTVARLGGDEFVVIVQGEGQGYTNAVAAVRRMQSAMAQPMKIDGRQLTVGISVGVSLFPQDGADAETLLKNADLALYQAKEKSKGGFQLFTAGLGREIQRRSSLEAQLGPAIVDGQFEVYYQPRFLATGGPALGLEALVRWRRPSGSLLEPEEFLPLAEQCGLMAPLGQEVLSAACAQASDLARAGFHLPVAVNISASQLSDDGLTRHLQAALGRFHLEPWRLELEISEEVLSACAGEPKELLGDLAGLGVGLVLDGLGAGRSSIRQLRALPWRRFKLDRELVALVDHDQAHQDMAAALVAMAHGLGVEVVAMGVESDGQLLALRELGCDEVQGILGCRPLPAGEVAGYLAKDQKKPPHSGAVK